MMTPTTAPVPPSTHSPEEPVVDREFLMSMARIPFIAVIWVAAAFASHLVWSWVSPETTNFGPLLVLCFGMLLAAFIDGWAFKVPNWCTLSLVVSGWMLGLCHDLNVGIDAGQGGLTIALLCTMVGFALLGPLLAISGMGQGDVKMLMGFGSWVGAYFGGRVSLEILALSFCLGAVIGGIFGLVMMVARRKFKQNASNFREIFTDLRVLVTQGPSQAAARGNSRRSRWDKLPYGVPLCVGFLGYLWYLWIHGQLPGQQ